MYLYMKHIQTHTVVIKAHYSMGCTVLQYGLYRTERACRQFMFTKIGSSFPYMVSIQRF